MNIKAGRDWAQGKAGTTDGVPKLYRNYLVAEHSVIELEIREYERQLKLVDTDTSE